MLTTSLELKNAFMQSERIIYIRIKIGVRIFDNDDVISVEYDSGSLAGEVFAIGSTYSNSIKITFSNLVEGLKELDEVSYEIGIELPNGMIEYVPMGIFVINEAIEMDRNNNKTTIECMDRMVMMGGAYVSSLIYPAPIREVALEIANKAGIQVSDTFDRLSADKIAKPEGYTYREAIGLIAQFEAGFATFDRYGKLTIRALSDPNFAIPPDNYFSKGLVKNEVFFRLGGISCASDNGDTVIQSGNTLGNQIILENRVMTKTFLDKIYQKIQLINYYSFSLKWQGNPILEAGDWIEVEDLEGNKFKTPNLNYKLTFNGGLSAESSAETATQSNATYQYKSPLQQKIEWINARIDAAGGNVIFEGIDQPSNPKEGDLWFKVIGPDKEILIYRKDADGNLVWEPQISTADIDKVAKEVDAVIADMVIEKERINQTITKADQAIADAGFAGVDATEAKANAVTALEKANTAKTNADKAIADVGIMNPKVTNAVADAAAAVTNANTAKTNAETALEKSQTGLTDSATALDKAGQALTKATATETATGSLTTSHDALTKTVGLKADKTELDKVNGTVTQHGLDITANATEIGVKADKSVVDTINQTVTAHSLSIKATADSLASKAEKTLVDSLSGTVATHSTTLTQTAKDIALKADSTEVNAIKGTVDTHSTAIAANAAGLLVKAEKSEVNTLTGKVTFNTNAIGINATAITARLTSTQVDSLVSTKNYVNETQLKASADGLQVGITKVSTDLANLEVGGRNLILGSQNLKLSKPSIIVNYLGKDHVTKVVDPVGATYINPMENYSNAKIDGEDYILSVLFTYKGVKGTTPQLYAGAYASVSGEIVEGRFTRIYIKTKATARIHMNFGGFKEIYLTEWKLEKGNKATDWSPAPEDMTTKVETADLEFKVDGIKTEFVNKTNAIEGINTTQTANILANANGLKTKAETTTVNVIKGTVDIHTGQISANATGLTSKAESSLVNTIKGTVDTHTTQISQNATAISARLTSVQVEGVLLGKKYVNETQLKATSDGLTVNIASTNTELGKSNTRITNVEATANGLQTTVLNKADKSQITQLAGQISSKVESATYNSKMTQLDNNINLKVSSGEVTTAILADKKIKDTRSDNQPPSWYWSNYPRQTVEELKFSNVIGVPNGTQYGQLSTAVTWSDASGGVITQTFRTSNGVYARTSVSNTNWNKWEQTAEVSNLVAQINLSPSGVYIQGKNIQLDGDVSMQIAFINKIKAIDISADRITAGTLNASNVNIINLNASKITSGTITGARSNWNLNTGKFVTNGVGGESIELENGKISSFSPDKLQSAVLDSASLRFHHNKGTGSQWVQISPYGTSYSSQAWQDVALFRTNIGLGLKPGENNSYSKNVVFSMYGVAPMIAFDVTNTALTSLRTLSIQAEGTNLIVRTADRLRVDSTNWGAGRGTIEGGIIESNSGQNTSTLRIDGDVIDRQGTGELFIRASQGVVFGNKARSARYNLELENVYSYGGGVASRLAGNEWTIHGGSGSLFLTPSGAGQAVYAGTKVRGTYYPMGASNFVTVSQRKFKEDIKPYENALSLLSTLQIRKYTKEGVDEIGLIVDEAPLQLVSADQLGISLYDYISLTAASAQQLSKISFDHERKLNKHEKEIQELKEKIIKLESAA